MSHRNCNTFFTLPTKQQQKQVVSGGLLCAFSVATFVQVGAAISNMDMTKHIQHILLPLVMDSPVKDFQVLSPFSHFCQVGVVVNRWWDVDESKGSMFFLTEHPSGASGGLLGAAVPMVERSPGSLELSQNAHQGLVLHQISRSGWSQKRAHSSKHLPVWNDGFSTQFHRSVPQWLWRPFPSTSLLGSSSVLYLRW